MYDSKPVIVLGICPRFCWEGGGQHPPVVKADSTHARGLGLIPGADRKKVVGSHYQTGYIFEWVYKLGFLYHCTL